MIAVDKVFILAFPDDLEKKRALFEARVKMLPLPENTPVEIHPLPSITEVNQTLRDYGLLPVEGGIRWEEASRACGHWSVWQQHEQHMSVLVLEEGFLPKSDHYQVLRTDEPWDMIYLGRFAYGSDIPLEARGLVSPGYSNGSYAYMIKASGMRKLVSSQYDQNVIPVGEFLSAMHDAHPSEDVAAMFEYRLTTMAPMKNFIEHEASAESTEEVSAGGYKPLHPGLFELEGNARASWVKKYVNPQLVQREFDLICDEPIDNVYTFPLFTEQFCKEFIEEAEHFGEWTSYRGKDNPPTDIKLDSLGFHDIYSSVLKEFLFPLLYHKYQLKGEAWKRLNSQHFIVRYIAGERAHLGLHNDGSYLSMIVTLNTDFEGGGTFFPKFKKLVKPEQPGYASIHPGLLGYLHGARPITRGKRYILTSFFFMGAQHPFAEGNY